MNKKELFGSDGSKTLKDVLYSISFAIAITSTSAIAGVDKGNDRPSIDNLSGWSQSQTVGNIVIGDSSDSSIMNVVDYHLDRMGIDKSSKHYGKISDLINAISLYESGNNSDVGINPKSSASGAFQNIDSNKITVINRINNLKNLKGVVVDEGVIQHLDKIKSFLTSGVSDVENLGARAFDKLPDEVSAMLTLTDLFSKSGSDKVFKKYFASDNIGDSYKLLIDLYSMHHTDLNPEANANIESKSKAVKNSLRD